MARCHATECTHRQRVKGLVDFGRLCQQLPRFHVATANDEFVLRGTDPRESLAVGCKGHGNGPSERLNLFEPGLRRNVINYTPRTAEHGQRFALFRQRKSMAALELVYEL